MKKVKLYGSLIGIAIVIMVLQPGCFHGSQKDMTDKPIIAVSILPQKYFVNQIAGDDFNVIVMIPPGESPATYDPTAKEMKKLHDAELYLRIGYIEFEKTWIRDIENSQPEMSFFDTSEGIQLEEMDHRHGNHFHKGIEPHIWISPSNVKIIAKNTYTALIEKMPLNKKSYKENLDVFIEKIDKIHEEISHDLKYLKNRSFIIYHPALTYFARDYGLEQYSIEKEGKEPDIRNMKQIIDMAQNKGIRSIFVQKQFNQDEANVIAREINGKVISIDPLSYNWDKEMIHIKNAIIHSTR